GGWYVVLQYTTFGKKEIIDFSKGKKEVLIVIQAVEMKLMGLLVKDSKTVKEVEVIWKIEMKRR
ncbi:hypothetical protein Tco_0503843, partial [Tanacetum coccineum]